MPCANHDSFTSFFPAQIPFISFSLISVSGTSLHLAYKENQGSLGRAVVKNPPDNAGDRGWLPGWGRSPRGRNGNLLQYSGLENPMVRGAWKAIVHGVAKSQT